MSTRAELINKYRAKFKAEPDKYVLEAIDARVKREASAPAPKPAVQKPTVAKKPAARTTGKKQSTWTPAVAMPPSYMDASRPAQDPVTGLPTYLESTERRPKPVIPVPPQPQQMSIGPARNKLTERFTTPNPNIQQTVIPQVPRREPVPTDNPIMDTVRQLGRQVGDTARMVDMGIQHMGASERLSTYGSQLPPDEKARLGAIVNTPEYQQADEETKNLFLTLASPVAAGVLFPAVVPTMTTGFGLLGATNMAKRVTGSMPGPMEDPMGFGFDILMGAGGAMHGPRALRNQVANLGVKRPVPVEPFASQYAVRGELDTLPGPYGMGRLARDGGVPVETPPPFGYSPPAPVEPVVSGKPYVAYESPTTGAKAHGEVINDIGPMVVVKSSTGKIELVAKSRVFDVAEQAARETGLLPQPEPTRRIAAEEATPTRSDIMENPVYQERTWDDNTPHQPGDRVVVSDRGGKHYARWRGQKGTVESIDAGGANANSDSWYNVRLDDGTVITGYEENFQRIPPEPVVPQVSARDAAFADLGETPVPVVRKPRAPRKPKTVEQPVVGKSVDVQGQTLPLNEDGTVTLYHGTTKQGAEGIRATGKLTSAGEPDVYLTTDPQGGGYGDGTVVSVRVSPKSLQVEDQFPDGRIDFRTRAGSAVKPVEQPVTPPVVEPVAPAGEPVVPPVEVDTSAVAPAKVERPAATGEPAATKQPWEMTRDEFKSKWVKDSVEREIGSRKARISILQRDIARMEQDLPGITNTTRIRQINDSLDRMRAMLEDLTNNGDSVYSPEQYLSSGEWLESYRDIVETAIRQGEPVPDSVRADHPSMVSGNSGRFVPLGEKNVEVKGSPESVAKAGVGKESKATGLTEGQAQYIREAVDNAKKEGLIENDSGYSDTVKSMLPEYSLVIRVPEDGTFSIPGRKSAADRLVDWTKKKSLGTTVGRRRPPKTPGESPPKIVYLKGDKTATATADKIRKSLPDASVEGADVLPSSTITPKQESSTPTRSTYDIVYKKWRGMGNSFEEGYRDVVATSQGSAITAYLDKWPKASVDDIIRVERIGPAPEPTVGKPVVPPSPTATAGTGKKPATRKPVEPEQWDVEVSYEVTLPGRKPTRTTKIVSVSAKTQKGAIKAVVDSGVKSENVVSATRKPKNEAASVTKKPRANVTAEREAARQQAIDKLRATVEGQEQGADTWYPPQTTEVINGRQYLVNTHEIMREAGATSTGANRVGKPAPVEPAKPVETVKAGKPEYGDVIERGAGYEIVDRTPEGYGPETTEPGGRKQWHGTIEERAHMASLQESEMMLRAHPNDWMTAGLTRDVQKNRTWLEENSPRWVEEQADRAFWREEYATNPTASESSARAPRKKPSTRKPKTAPVETPKLKAEAPTPAPKVEGTGATGTYTGQFRYNKRQGVKSPKEYEVKNPETGETTWTTEFREDMLPQSVSEYTSGFDKLKAGKVTATLNAPFMRDGVLTTRGRFVEDSIANGATIEISQRGKRELTFPDGSFFDGKEITSTALDYAEHLIKQRQSTPSTRAVETPKAEGTGATIRKQPPPQVGQPTAMNADAVTITYPSGKVETVNGTRYLFPGFEDFDFIVTRPRGAKSKGLHEGWTVREKTTGERIYESPSIPRSVASQGHESTIQDALNGAMKRLNGIGRQKFGDIIEKVLADRTPTPSTSAATPKVEGTGATVEAIRARYLAEHKPVGEIVSNHHRDNIGNWVYEETRTPIYEISAPRKGGSTSEGSWHIDYKVPAVFGKEPLATRTISFFTKAKAQAWIDEVTRTTTTPKAGGKAGGTPKGKTGGTELHAGVNPVALIRDADNLDIPQGSFTVERPKANTPVRDFDIRDRFLQPIGIYDASGKPIQKGTYDRLGEITLPDGTVENVGTQVGKRIRSMEREISAGVLEADHKLERIERLVTGTVPKGKLSPLANRKATNAAFSDFIDIVEKPFDDPQRIAVKNSGSPIGEALKIHDEMTEGFRQYIIDSRKGMGIDTPADWGITEQGYYRHLFMGDIRIFDGTKLVDTARTYAEAQAKAVEYLKKNPNAQITARGRNIVGGDPAVRVSTGKYFRLVDKLSGEVQLSMADIMADLRGIVGRKAAKQKFAGFLLERKGVGGYSRAYLDVMRMHAAQVFRTQELSKMNRAVTPMVEKLRSNGKPGLAAEVEAHINDLWGTPSKFELDFGEWVRNTPVLRNHVANPAMAFRGLARMLTGLQSNLKLRVSPRSALVNLVQPFSTLWPYISTKDMATIYSDLFKLSTHKMLAEKGVVQGTGKLETANITHGSRVGSALNPLGWFQKASEFNRGAGYLFGLREAKRLGLSEADAHALGLSWAEKVEFDNSTVNIQPVLRTPGARILGQFKSFMGKNLENVRDVVKPEGPITKGQKAARIAKWATAQVGVGGIKSFGMAAEAAGALVIIRHLAKQLQSYGMEKEEAEKWADAVYYGAPSLIGQDLSASVAILEAPYGRTMLEQAGNFVFGPTVGTAIAVGEGIKAKDTDRIVKGLTSAYKPYTVVKNAVQGKPQSIKAGQKEIPLTDYEAIMRALGFTPVKQSKYYDEQDLRREENKFENARVVDRPKIFESLPKEKQVQLSKDYFVGTTWKKRQK